MWRLTFAFIAICLLPYAYAAWFWMTLGTANVSGEAVWLTFLLIVAVPFWMAIAAWMAVASGLRTAAKGATRRRPLAFALGAGVAGIALVVAIGMTTSASRIHQRVNPDVEPGRNSIGQICTQEGRSRVCRADPDRPPGQFDRVRTVGELEEYR